MLKIKIDSRKVKPGDTFVALKGQVVDGHDFVQEAINKRATKVILEKDLTAEGLINKIREVFDDNKKYKEMKENLKKMSMNNSSDVIYEKLKDLIKC